MGILQFIADGRVRAASLTLAFFVLLQPSPGHTYSYFAEFGVPLVEIIDRAALVAISTIAIALFAYRKKINAFSGCIIGLVALITLSSLIQNGDWTIWINEWLPCVAVVFIVSTTSRSNLKSILKSFFVACFIYLILNLIYIVSHPQYIGFSTVDSLPGGHRNILFRVGIPAFCCSLVLDCLEGKRFSTRTILVYALFLLELLVAYSATSTCATVAMGLLALLIQWRKPRFVLNIYTYFIGYIVLFIGFVILRFQNKLILFVSSVLHRSATFSGRTTVWDDAFAHLANMHFFTGYGTGYMWSTLSIGTMHVKHAHSDILHLIMLGGVFALAFFIGAVVLAAHRLFLNRADRAAAALAIGLAGFFIVSLMEVAVCPGFFFLLAFSYYYFAPNAKDARTC